jgi:predicted  nucleic acid-binding Zn-ribbon protein
MKELIGQLSSLNEIDTKLSMLRKDLERLPKDLAEKEKALKNMRIVSDRLKGEIIKLKIEADSIELEVKSGEEALKRYATQMNIIRTTKELEAIRRQMETQRIWNRDNENKALELMEKVDVRQKELDKHNATIAESEKVLASDIERVTKDLGELKSQSDTLMASRNDMAAKVPEKELAIYNRVVATRGTAISKVERGICSACFMKLPAQFHNLALLGLEVVTCPSCGRILTAG